ncbi:unnamed protein product [Bursaphelenchus okinawaensis]|uniref:MARVEL domain-containing protein n=1 Tax=Bursaphelenchus okinawaensis TaxID=465554 RepID=A0A811L633_9BILA|nr:unnamed protein product [Bursaphelenchus okinawaensis]CAG9118242.1 unnamed protein product [Bursaphelenchus okinawaensis]
MVVSTAGWFLKPGRLPRYIFNYPHSVLIVVRVFSTLCSICTLIIWNSAKRQFSHDSGFRLVAVFDLLSLLCILLSFWFTIQKFYYVKLDAVFSFTSIVFILAGIAVTGSVSEDVKTNDLFYIIICHLYLLIAQLFSFGWAILCTKNTASKLFISNWGRGVNPTEIEMLEEDF